jgi:hypothetical protein
MIGRMLAANRLALASTTALPSFAASDKFGLPKRCPRFLANRLYGAPESRPAPI